MNHGRYWETPCVGKIKGIRPTIKDRIIKRIRRKEKPDIYPICDYWPAVYPTKK